MKLPESLFVLINPMMKFLLLSPLHVLMSNSLMLISFKGRKSGKVFTTPVRYIKDERGVRCFTAKSNQWWRNVKADPHIKLRIAGRDYQCQATVTTDKPDLIGDEIRNLLKYFPGDSAYYEIQLNSDKTPVEKDLVRASHASVMVEVKL